MKRLSILLLALITVPVLAVINSSPTPQTITTPVRSAGGVSVGDKNGDGLEGNGQIAASLVASRITGPAPLAVHFDATGTTHTNNTLDTFRELYYHFVFADPGSGTWTLTGHSKNSRVGGPLAAHVFETPGTYNVGVRAQDSSGNYDDTFVTITVTDPDVVYAGTNTVCISSIGDFTAAPAGCLQLTSIPTLESNKRYLFRAGETFPGFNVNFLNDWQIGKFGAGADPIFTSHVKVNSSNPGSSTNWASRGVIMNLDVTGRISAEISAQDILFFRNRSTERYAFGSALEFYYDSNGGGTNPGYVWPKNIFVVENNLNANKAEQYGIYGLAENLAVMGNNFENPIEHNIRTPLAYKSIIAYNRLVNPGFLKHHITMRARGLNPYQSALANESSSASRYLIIAHNALGEGDDLDWSVTMAPSNDSVAEGVEDGIVEDNYFDAAATHEIAFGGRRLTSRNNSGTSVVTTTTFAQSGALPAPWLGPFYIDAAFVAPDQPGT